MRSGIKVKTAAALFLCILASSPFSFGQSYNYSNFQSQDGLPGTNVVYSISQDRGGLLWLGTTEGLARFDGLRFFPVHYPDSTVTGHVSASLKDRDGRLWFGFSSGAICTGEAGILAKVMPDDSSAVAELLQSPDGNIYAFLQQSRSVLRIDAAKARTEDRLLRGNDDVSSAAFMNDGTLLLGGQGKILHARISGKQIVTDVTIDKFDYARVTAICQMGSSSKYLIGTEGNGIYRLDMAGPEPAVSRIEDYADLGSVSVRDIYKDESGTFWVSSVSDGVIKIVFDSEFLTVAELKTFNSASGLPGDRINTVFRDSENNTWIGHNGRGLSRLSSEAFSFYNPGEDKTNNIIHIGIYKNEYFLGTPEGFYIFNISEGKAMSFTSLSSAVGKNTVSAYQADRKGNLWIGTRGGGLYLRKPNGAVTLFYRSGESGQDNINDIEADDSNVWIASVNGVSIIDAVTGRLKEYYSMNQGRLPFNNTNKLFLTPSGSAWVATQSITFDRIIPGSDVISSSAEMGGSRRNKLLSVSEGGGYVWAGTEGYGLFGMSGDTVINITSSNGLFNDKVNSILVDSSGIVWLGHDRGLSMYNLSRGSVRGLSTDFARSGQCNPDALLETPDGKILIGTTEGLIVYERSKDLLNDIAPISNIMSITIGDSSYAYTPSIRLPYRKRYQVAISYTGVKLADPQRVFYSTYMENYDDGWSGFTLEKEKSYSLGDGKYTFSFISATQEGLRQENPLTFEITIKPPLWRRWWFLLAALASLATLVVYIIRIREKAAKIREKELEQKVEERTVEVETQKKEIERQNIEITDSINYAKRIQSNVLPDVSKLKESFADAFILFHPRDIVSGDFYWFDRAEDGTMVVVCADSTGHGVPGAFMSMIGASFLQDIVKRQKTTSPSKILSQLDRQIFSMLNQNSGKDIANDGMDLVVCEYNPAKRHIRFASAMRPVILVMDGELYYIKGNKHSVGGESVNGKYFDDQEYYLKNGDMIYLFTDGIADQFGGPLGKKLLIPKLRSFIEENHKLPLSEQKVELSKFFYEWKKDEDQVDDVLFMGLRV